MAKSKSTKKGGKNKSGKKKQAKSKTGANSKKKNTTGKSSSPAATITPSPSVAGTSIATNLSATTTPPTAEAKITETRKAIIVETSERKTTSSGSPAVAYLRPEPIISVPNTAPAAPVEPPHPIDIMAKELNKTILSYVRGITKPMLVDYLRKLPSNVPFYIVPRYGEKNTFTIDITDGTKKVTIPAKGTYTLVG